MFYNADISAEATSCKIKDIVGTVTETMKGELVKHLFVCLFVLFLEGGGGGGGGGDPKVINSALTKTLSKTLSKLICSICFGNDVEIL